MSDTFNVTIGNDPENIYDLYPANREFKKRAEDENHPIVTNAKETGGFGWTDEDETVHTIDPKYIGGGGGNDYDMVIYCSVDPEGGYIDVEYPDETELANTIEKMRVCVDNNVPYSGKIAVLAYDNASTYGYVSCDVTGYSLFYGTGSTPLSINLGVRYPTDFSRIGKVSINLGTHTAEMTPNH